MTDIKITEEELLKQLEDISNENNCEKFNELYKNLYETENFKTIKELIEKKTEINKMDECNAEIIMEENINDDLDQENHGFDDELERVLRLSAEEYEIEMNRRIQENMEIE